MNNKIEAKRLAEQPYAIEVKLDQTTDDQQIYFARVLEIEGCFGQGTTQEEAVADLKLATIDFIESLLEDNLSVPKPFGLIRTSATALSNTHFYKLQGKKLHPQESIPEQLNYVFELRTA